MKNLAAGYPEATAVLATGNLGNPAIEEQGGKASNRERKKITTCNFVGGKKTVLDSTRCHQGADTQDDSR